MTLPTEQKRHFLRRFKGCYQHTYPKGVTIHIGDFTQFLKCKGPDITTVQEYLEKHVRRHVREVLEDNNKTVIHQYCLLDRGGNLAKKLFTGHKRNRVPPAEERDDDKLNIPSDGLLPVNWDNLVANKAIAKREIEPLYYRALIQVPVTAAVGMMEDILTSMLVTGIRAAPREVPDPGLCRNAPPDQGGSPRPWRGSLQQGVGRPHGTPAVECGSDEQSRHPQHPRWSRKAADGALSVPAPSVHAQDSRGRPIGLFPCQQAYPSCRGTSRDNPRSHHLHRRQ